MKKITLLTFITLIISSGNTIDFSPRPSGVESAVNFFLYTRSNQLTPERLVPGIQSQVLRRRINYPFKVICHGFIESASTYRIQLTKNAILNQEDVNVILVDWGTLARNPNYAQASTDVGPVGEYLSKLIYFILSNGAPIDNFHLIGFSLGAHIVGNAGKFIRTPRRIPRITGLDPAGPLFSNTNRKDRLFPLDGDYVDVIHTSGKTFGYYGPTGDIDFYVNGGTPPQPICAGSPDLGAICSHVTALYLFIESINPANRFTALECDNVLSDYRSCRATPYYMGYYIDKRARGLYYVSTSNVPPFPNNNLLQQVFLSP